MQSDPKKESSLIYSHFSFSSREEEKKLVELYNKHYSIIFSKSEGYTIVSDFIDLARIVGIRKSYETKAVVSQDGGMLRLEKKVESVVDDAFIDDGRNHWVALVAALQEFCQTSHSAIPIQLLERYVNSLLAIKNEYIIHTKTINALQTILYIIGLFSKPLSAFLQNHRTGKEKTRSCIQRLHVQDAITNMLCQRLFSELALKPHDCSSDEFSELDGGFDSELGIEMMAVGHVRGHPSPRPITYDAFLEIYLHEQNNLTGQTGDLQDGHTNRDRLASAINNFIDLFTYLGSPSGLQVEVVNNKLQLYSVWMPKIPLLRWRALANALQVVATPAQPEGASEASQFKLEPYLNFIISAKGPEARADALRQVLRVFRGAPPRSIPSGAIRQISGFLFGTKMSVFLEDRGRTGGPSENKPVDTIVSGSDL